MPPRRKRAKKATTPVELSESEQPEDNEHEDEDSDYSPATHGKGAGADDDGTLTANVPQNYTNSHSVSSSRSVETSPKDQDDRYQE